MSDLFSLPLWLICALQESGRTYRFNACSRATFRMQTVLNPSCRRQAFLSILVSLETLQDGEAGIKNHTDPPSMSKTLIFSFCTALRRTRVGCGPTLGRFGSVAGGHVEDYMGHAWGVLLTDVWRVTWAVQDILNAPAYICMSMCRGANVTLESP